MAAEIAMMVRFTEDPDMFRPLCFAEPLARHLLTSIHEACQGQKSAISFTCRRAGPSAPHQVLEYCANPPIPATSSATKRGAA
jgi:hypothetical protein